MSEDMPEADPAKQRAAPRGTYAGKIAHCPFCGGSLYAERVGGMSVGGEEWHVTCLLCSRIVKVVPILCRLARHPFNAADPNCTPCMKELHIQGEMPRPRRGRPPKNKEVAGGL